MVSFWIGVCGLVLLLVAAFFYPMIVFRKENRSADQHRYSVLSSNVSLYQESLASIEQQFQHAEIDESVYNQMVLELQRQLLTDIPDNTSETGCEPSSTQLTTWMFVALASIIFIVVVSAVLYTRLGAFSDITLEEDYNHYLVMHQQQLDKKVQFTSVDSDGDALLERLKLLVSEDEHNAGYRYMLASLFVMRNQFALAADHYKALLMANPAQERLLSEYLQVLYLAAGRKVNERVQFVADRALELNPHNQDVLGLLAMDAYENKAYGKAIDYWRQMLPVLDPTSEKAQMVRYAIEEAKNRSVSPE